MVIDKSEEIIGEARRRFDTDLHSTCYAQVHRDSNQLDRLLSLVGPTRHQRFLDLGTGDGYVAMALASRDSTCAVIALDIAEEAIDRCAERAEEQALTNMQFQPFDGITIPLDDNSVDGVFCRHAFHHFPTGEMMLTGISRIIKRGGHFVFSDPLRDQADNVDFVNRFQQLKGDGHVRIWKREEIIALFQRHNLHLLDSFETVLQFSRNHDLRYKKLLGSTPNRVLDAYGVHAEGRKISLTFRILNAVFVNQKMESQLAVQADCRSNLALVQR